MKLCSSILLVLILSTRPCFSLSGGPSIRSVVWIQNRSTESKAIFSVEGQIDYPVYEGDVEMGPLYVKETRRIYLEKQASGANERAWNDTPTLPTPNLFQRVWTNLKRLIGRSTPESTPTDGSFKG